MMSESESESVAVRQPWTAELVKEMFDRTLASSLVAETLDAGSEGRRQGLRRAAAVMGAFDPAVLRGVDDDGKRGEWRLGFADDCLSFSDNSGNRRWVLKPIARHEALASMTTEADFLEALDANPDLDSRDPLRRMLRKTLAQAGPTVQLDGLSASELAALVQVAGWSPLLANRIGPIREIARRRAKLLLMSPFEALAGKDTFAGRRRELAQLRSFVDALDSEGVLEAVSRVPLRVQRGLSKDVGGVYVIEAPGGMGKSALVARFILQHTTENPSTPLLFLYLDWEDPTLVATEPETMLLEIVRQLGTQLPDLIEPFLVDTLTASLRAHRERFASEVTRQRTVGGEARPSLDDAYSKRDREAKRREASLPGYTASVGDWVYKASALSGRPVLLVLDTFERVQRFGGGQVEAVRSVVDGLCRSAPSLRVVIATRAPLKTFTLGLRPPIASTLGPLDDEAAGTLLRKWGVTAEDASKLARQVGGSPLSLTLAARIYRQTGLSGVDTIGRHRWLFFSIREA